MRLCWIKIIYIIIKRILRIVFLQTVLYKITIFSGTCFRCNGEFCCVCSWLSALESTKWLQHLSLLLKASLLVVNAVDRDHRPVLVHCSDGWDRTPQIAALAKLLLDPYYRTIEVSGDIMNKTLRIITRGVHKLSHAGKIHKGLFKILCFEMLTRTCLHRQRLRGNVKIFGAQHILINVDWTIESLFLLNQTFPFNTLSEKRNKRGHCGTTLSKGTNMHP